MSEKQPVPVVLLTTALLAVIVAAGCGDRVRPAPRVEVTTPSGSQSGDVIIAYVLYDTDSWPASIEVKYSLDGGANFYDAAVGSGGDGTTNLLTNERGVAHSFVWDSTADAGYVNEDNARITIWATTRKTSLPSTTASFLLENFSLGQWEPNIRIDDDVGTAEAESPALTAEGDNVYAVWTDYRNGNADIYFSYSLDAGTTWATAVRVDDDAGTSIQKSPSIAYSDTGNLYVVWEDYRNGDSDVYMATGTNPGAGYTFSVNSEISSASSISAEEPVVAFYNVATYLYVCVAWADGRDGDRDIYFRQSWPSMNDWYDEILVNDDATTADQYGPAICVDGLGSAYIAWTDTRNGNPDIYASAGIESGGEIAFGSNIRADDDAGTATSNEPSIAVDGTNVYIAYTDQRNLNQDIFVATSVDSAVSFATNLKASDDTGTAAQYQPAIAVNGSTGETYLVFADERSDGSSIYFCSSTTPGVSFDPNERIDDYMDTTVDSQPCIAYGSRVFIAFTDTRNTDSDIYFTRRPKD